MSDTDTPYSDSMQQWDKACQRFQDEFGFDAHEIITINTIREMFSELVEEYKLSLNASISLMYGLYFLGYITLIEMMKAKDEEYEIGDLTDFYAILDAADNWAGRSMDIEKLHSWLQNIEEKLSGKQKKIAEEILKECKGFRAPGTYTFSQTFGFGMIAGTYRQRHGIKHFWNVRAKLADHTIRFNLQGHDFATVVIQVEDPNTVLTNLTPIPA